MATYDRKELVREVLLRLGVLDADETPLATQAADVDRAAQGVLEDLYADGKLPFDIQGDIPARYFIPLSFLIAKGQVVNFGAFAREAAILREADEAMRAINRMNATTYQGAVVQADYF